MTDITLTKHHGLGNDFLVAFDPPIADLPAFARQVCDRRRGIGADGLLVATEVAGHDARMVLFNADGSRAEMSGNGIRCFAQAVASRTGTMADQRILTDAGPRLLTLAATADPAIVLATVDMGDIQPLAEPVGWEALGCLPERPVAHVSLGNPHSVVGVESVDDIDLQTLGALVPHVNLEVVAPGEQRHEVRMRVHERGAGITEACGTGATAAAHAAASWGLATPLDGQIVVRMDGGTATVSLDTPRAGSATLTGPAAFVGTVTVALPVSNAGDGGDS